MTQSYMLKTKCEMFCFFCKRSCELRILRIPVFSFLTDYISKVDILKGDSADMGGAGT